MPNEISQPFDQTQRDPRDERLVGQVLGPDVAAEMEALTSGQTKPDKTQEPSIGLEISEAEQAETEVVEQEVTAEQLRQQYVEWADDFGKDKKWVIETFIFEPDGKVRVEGNLDLSDTGISELPPGLYRVEGQLILNNNQITTIENIPDSVTELHLNNNQITTIENIPDSVTRLYLSKNQITTIENIPNSVIELWLKNNQITKKENIPDSVTYINIDSNPIES